MGNEIDNVKKHLHIIVCGDNVNSLGIVRSLGEKGIHPLAIIVQENHIPLVERSKYVQHVIKTSSMKESLEVLKTFANKNCEPFVYTTDDNHQSLLDQRYDEYKDFFYFYRSNAVGVLTKYMDKAALCEAAEQCGIRIPLCEILNKGEKPKRNIYPIFIKTINSYDGGWKHDVAVCENDDELRDAYSKMVSNKLLIQPFIEKKNEYSLQGISINDGADVYMPYSKQYTRFSKTSFGGYMYYEQCVNQDLKNKIQKLLQNIHFNGLFEIEFLVDKQNQLWFLEVNFRSSASNYGVNHGGVNLPYLWADSELKGEINTSNILLREKRFYVVNEGTDIRYIKQIGLWKLLHDFFNADSYYLWNIKDLLPVLLYWPNWFYKKIQKKLKL